MASWCWVTTNKLQRLHECQIYEHYSFRVTNLWPFEQITEKTNNNSSRWTSACSEVCFPICWVLGEGFSISIRKFDSAQAFGVAPGRPETVPRDSPDLRTWLQCLAPGDHVGGSDESMPGRSFFIFYTEMIFLWGGPRDQQEFSGTPSCYKSFGFRT